MENIQFYSVNKAQIEVEFEASLAAYFQNEKLRQYFQAFAQASLPFFEDFFESYYQKLSTIEVSVVCCDEPTIKKLNTEYRKKNTATDVLSFPVHMNLRDKTSRTVTGALSLGDIYICLPVAQTQAKMFDLSLEEELVHLLVHGFLHLLGFDHEISKKEEILMQEQEGLLLLKTAELMAQKD